MQATLRVPYDITDADLLRISRDNPGWHVELIDGAVVMSPTSTDGGRRSAELLLILGLWGKSHGYVAFDSSTGFRVGEKTVLSPDTALMRRERWDALTPEERENFTEERVDVVVELVSKSDAPAQIRTKCERWRREGVAFVLMIDPYRKHVESWGEAPEGFPRDWSAVFD
jgi:Uma2 family endonuclease